MNSSIAARLVTALVAGLLGRQLLLTSAAAVPEADRPWARPDPSEAFFTSGTIPHLRIQITGTNLAELRRNNRRYVRATVREEGTVYTDVGIHLKGAAGSFRGLDHNPALTLNFDKFKDEQKFHGLDKLHLNNSVQDESYMAEYLCGELFRQAGVPAPRVTHARVELNGRDLGLYVLKEGFDRTFLRRHFQSADGNLYDGGFLRDITEPLELTSGSRPRDRSDLKALAQAALEPDRSKRWARLQQTLDVDRFISFIAMEILTHHWDGYALKKNNYRVYHDPDTDKIVFLPTGMDQMFWEPAARLLPNMHGLVASALLRTPEGRSRYHARVAFLATNVFVLENLTNRIDQLHKRLRPALAAISAQDARNHDGAVAHFRSQVVQRARKVADLASVPEPKPAKFDRAGVAPLSDWYPLDPGGTGRLEQTTDSGQVKCLRIIAGAGGRCVASWRARVMIESGSYLFEGRLRTAGVVPLESDLKTKGLGAGLRQSRPGEPRSNSVVGTADWQIVQHELTVEEPLEEVVLLCELRASEGEVWFDLSSLRLRKR